MQRDRTDAWTEGEIKSLIFLIECQTNDCFQKLEILLRTEKSAKLIPWNLPNLQSIHTSVESLIPIGESLPSLNVLRISNHTIREGRFSLNPIERCYVCKITIYV